VVGLGGMIGATLRYGVSTWIKHHSFPFGDDELPRGTLTVNVLGSFLLGALTFAGAGSTTMLLFGVGLCGSFTTFSSFAVDTVQLWEQDRPVLAVGYAGGNFLGALGAIGLAWLVVVVGLGVPP
jgi:CrcB protein